MSHYYGSFSLGQQLLLAILPRIMSFISFCCAGYMVYSISSNKKYRSRVYHRIMFGLSCNIMALNICQLWGPAAVPEGTPNVLGARGTTATCTVQGFWLQFGFVVPSYYCALSLYSFVAVRSNFDVSKYRWIEKWIHIGVYIYPALSATYLLSIDGFNFHGYKCWIASVPLGCGGNSGVVCTRGPQNIGQLQWLLAGLPIMLILFIPTLVMVTLYVEVRRKQSTRIIQAKTVAWQGTLYLLAFYWSYFLGAVNSAVLFSLGRNVFVLSLLSRAIMQGIGLWILLAYNYFRLCSLNQIENGKNCTENEGTPRGFHPDDICCGEVETIMAASNSPSCHDKNVNLRKYSLTIFDGTNPSAQFADFVFEGDDEDEEKDGMEAQKWQNVIQS